MIHKGDLLINVGVINTKNGLRIGSFGDDITDRKILANWVITKEANKLCKRYSEILNIPVYNHYKDF
ncbi:MAG TPA: hypothetical protein VIK86_00975 [Candidatus Paceibacterota bacterium]